LALLCFAKKLGCWLKGITFEEGLRLDLLVENKVIVEIKAVETVNPVWDAQVLSHLKLTGLRLGYLINFNVPDQTRNQEVH